MFLVTSVTTLRERTSGTLVRLLAMPMGKLDFLLGYALAFGLLAAVQSALAVALCVWVLDLTVVGTVWMLLLVAVVVRRLRPPVRSATSSAHARGPPALR